MNIILRTTIIGALIIVCGALPALAKDVKFEASLDRSKIAIGETTQLGLSFQGTQSMPAPDIGNIDGLEIRYLGPSTMMTVINGQVSSSITHMYSVMPLKVGKFQIGPLTFKFKGDDYTCNMVFLEVTEEKTVQQQAPAPRQTMAPAEMLNLQDKIYVTLDAGKQTAYVNELIPVTVKLYVNRMNVSDIQLPTFDQTGFSKIEFKEPKQYRERVGSELYDVLEFKTSIFGTKPGDYRLGPAKIKCNVMVRKRTAPRSDDFFGPGYRDDSFYDDFFTRFERYPMELKSKEAQVTVMPLPAEGKPADFSGAVGDYQFIYSASPTKVRAGDPITVRMDINGTGNFNTVLSPKIDNFSGFKVYDAQVRTGENRKAFSQVMIPETDKVTQIPKATFSYFDVSKKQYKTITQPAIPIEVEKVKEEAPAPVVGPAPTPAAPSASPAENLARDIVFIKESPGRWKDKGRDIYRSKSFYAIIILPLVFIIALYIFQSRKNRMERDTAYAGRVSAFRSSKKGFSALKHQIKEDDPKVFYETLFKTLQDYLGYRLSIPPAGITADVADSILSSKNVDLTILRKIKKLFEACDMARFAFSDADHMKMQDDMNELKDIVNYLEKRKI